MGHQEAEFITTDEPELLFGVLAESASALAAPTVQTGEGPVSGFETGNPNAAELPDWPEVTAGRTSWMVFDNQPAVKEDLRKTKLDLIESVYRERSSTEPTEERPYE